MALIDRKFDAVIIGGGFYGSAIAIYLVQKRGFSRVLLIEREDQLLSRASYNNQARVHNGYHYPRSFTTAFRSRKNLPKFVDDWPQIVKQDFTKLYAIARRNSKVTANQFERFCKSIGAKISPAEPALRALFDIRLIEDVFLVEEYVFDASRLGQWAETELAVSGVRVQLKTTATSISNSVDGDLMVELQPQNGEGEIVNCQYVFNCTYSGLNQLRGGFPGTQTNLKQEIAEMALIQVPPILKDLGITVMDGPFFSLMPFPSRDLHTLSHVRYTPHFSWKDDRAINPYQKLADYDCITRYERMIRDVGRYLPAALDSKYVESIFEVKTVLVKSEVDDARPILFEKYSI